MTATLSPHSYPDTYKVNYFSNNGVADATLRITNVGTQNDPTGDLCALIYVFDPNQELAERCSCAVTPDGLLTLSVETNLTADTLTGRPLTTGDVKILSSTSCDAASALISRITAPL